MVEQHVRHGRTADSCCQMITLSSTVWQLPTLIELLPPDPATHAAINSEATQGGRTRGQFPYALHWDAVRHLCVAC